MQKPKDYRFYNLPRKHDLDDYKSAINKIIKKYSNTDGLVSIYNWGDPSTPGISDIDIVFVLGNKARPLQLSKRSFYFLNAETRYLVRHPFVFINEDDFKKIRYVYPEASLNLLHGKDIEIEKLSAEDSRNSKISLLNDIIIRHYPRDFISQLVEKSINARDTLLRLNSLKYSIRALKDITNENNREWGSKLKLVKGLREGWFADNDFNLLVSMNKDAIGIAMGIIEKFRNFLLKEKLVGIRSGDKIAYKGIKNNSLFLKGWNKNAALLEMHKAARNMKKYYSILPIELSAQLFEYSRYDGLISSHIKKFLDGSLSYDFKNKKAVEKRICILNKQAELALKLKHSDFAAFFDFGYRNNSGINNYAIKLYDKLRF